MVYGLWFAVYGLWFMVYGLWFMVYGLWLKNLVEDDVARTRHFSSVGPAQHQPVGRRPNRCVRSLPTVIIRNPARRSRIVAVNEVHRALRRIEAVENALEVGAFLVPPRDLKKGIQTPMARGRST